MPELTEALLESFHKVTPAEHRMFKSADKVNVMKNGEVVEVKKVGRPKKHPSQKENIVAIRLSKFFIEKLKERAGEVGWQTYAKKILEEHLKG